MALSGLFLLLFLAQHFVINSLSLGSGDYFNAASHFMGNNGIVQFIIQPILIIAVLFHLIAGLYLDVVNRNARNVKYQMNSPGKNSSWMSRNMVITGIMVLLFLGLHFYDFWIPEINYKYIEGNSLVDNRYYPDLVEKFKDPVRTGIYVLSFVFLSLHLMHGFQSAFQSVGFRHNKYTPMIQKLGLAYAILIPLGFVVIAVVHYVSHL